MGRFLGSISPFGRDLHSRVTMLPAQEGILFVCVENAGRSQMAQAFAEKLGLKAMSAGTVPSARVNPVVVEAMRERGIDLIKRSPKMLTADMISGARLVVTIGCSSRKTVLSRCSQECRRSWLTGAWTIRKEDRLKRCGGLEM